MTQANRRTEQRAEGRAQEVSNDAAGTGVIVAGRLSTGREGWTEVLRTFMRERPMMGAALMIATGYMAAKFLRR